MVPFITQLSAHDKSTSLPSISFLILYIRNNEKIYQYIPFLYIFILLATLTFLKTSFAAIRFPDETLDSNPPEYPSDSLSPGPGTCADVKKCSSIILIHSRYHLPPTAHTPHPCIPKIPFRSPALHHMPLADGDVQGDAIAIGRQVDDIRHLPFLVIKDFAQMPTETNHCLGRLHIPMDGQLRTRLNGIQHPLGPIRRRIPQVQVHPETRRSLGLGSQGIEGMLVNEHRAIEIPSLLSECHWGLRSERQHELLPECRSISRCWECHSTHSECTPNSRSSPSFPQGSIDRYCQS